jgi:hypothetical protein
MSVADSAASQGRFRTGDVVEVRDAAEILATLDSEGCRDALPFMPEMLRHLGQRFVVSARVDRICDTVTIGGGPKSRRMSDTVFLEDLRCDGSAHGGCQAGCRMYWKEEWLKPADVEPPTASASADDDALRDLEQTVLAQTSAVSERDGVAVEVYRCQATEAYAATTALSRYDPRQYVRELANGNVPIGRFLRVSLRAQSYAIARTLRRFLRVSRRALRSMKARELPVRVESRGTHGNDATAEPLGLRPGDWVQVRTSREIARTLDKQGKNLGLTFDIEMLPYRDGIFRVRDVVKRIIDETSGEMIELRRDCIVLDGVACSGDRSTGRWFCPRAIVPFWREAWLRRVDPPVTPQHLHHSSRPSVPTEQSHPEETPAWNSRARSCAQCPHASDDALASLMLAIRLATR